MELEQLLDLRLQRRRDLRFQQADAGPAVAGRPHAAARWTVLDPLSRHSFRLGFVEHWLLTRADGRRTIGQLVQRLRSELPTVSMSDSQLLSVAHTLYRNGLLWNQAAASDPPRRGNRLHAWLSSMVVWQIRGLQPDGWLSRLAPHTNSLFSAAAVRFWLWAAGLTAALVLLDFHRLAVQSFSLSWLLHPAAGGTILLVLVATRAAHELGHALVCKRFGIRCPDIGLFLILGAPCVYCDVSESWQLPHRWQRAAVAAAGMYVELVVATLAAWLWLVTVEGPVHTLALQTMLVCSVSTLVINANPLMRFDGYYILADWLDEVNLRAKADALAGAQLRRWVLGPWPQGQTAGEATPRRRFLVAFSLAGWLYRAVLSVTIASVLVALYSGWNLSWVGRILAAAILVSWWGVPAVKLMRDLVQHARQSGRRWRLGLCAAGIVVAVALVPIPHRRFGSGWLQPREARGVYASATGQLVASSVADGQQVAAGEVLFQLHSDSLSTRHLRYQQSAEVAEIRLAAATRRRDMHDQEVDLVRAANELAEARSWATSAEEDLQRLTLCAPIAGQLVAMPAAESPGVHPVGFAMEDRVSTLGHPCQGATWCDRSQRGRWVRQGDMLACICSQDSLAVIPLNESQLAAIAAGTRVRLRLNESRRVVLDAQVRTVAQIDELASPWQPTPSGAAAGSLGAAAIPRFAAVIDLPPDLNGLPGTTVEAVFVAQPTTLVHTLGSWLSANLRLLAD
ncbi:MAG: hypothetical protein KDA45_02760 [Planctomycetales bacterium]|nr:hypothetical protein [Planctomycetales bacterium]